MKLAKEKYVKTYNNTQEIQLYDVYNIKTNKYIKEDLFSFSAYSAEKSSESLKGFYTISEMIETDTKNEYGTYYEDKYYIMDSNGNEVYNMKVQYNTLSDEYEYINNLSGKKYLIGIDGNNKYGIIDTNGNIIVDFKYDKLIIQDTFQNSYVPNIAFIDSANNMYIYDLINCKNIIKVENVTQQYPITYHGNYIVILGDIYNYEGKLIYSNK